MLKGSRLWKVAWIDFGIFLLSFLNIGHKSMVRFGNCILLPYFVHKSFTSLFQLINWYTVLLCLSQQGNDSLVQNEFEWLEFVCYLLSMQFINVGSQGCVVTLISGQLLGLKPLLKHVAQSVQLILKLAFTELFGLVVVTILVRL